MSLDGRIALPDGCKANIGGEGDRKVLEEALAWSDGALIGGETFRTHKSTCLIRDERLINKRLKEGRSKQPIALVVSNKREYSLEWQFFKQPIMRWLISTNNSSFSQSKLVGFQKHINLNDNLKEILLEIKNEGLSKLALLGGAHLINSFLMVDAVNELQITITPKIIGGKYSWVPHDSINLPLNLGESDSWVLKENKELKSNEIVVRYLRNYKN